jgi:hypothetical protein
MFLLRKNGAVSNTFRVKLYDSSSTNGAGLTGLTSASTGLIISSIADNEATATAYTVAGSTIETITTLGTFAAPTATKIRFKEVDATNHKGLYEVQIADARMAVSSAKGLVLSFSGATNLAQQDLTIQLEEAPADVTKWLGTAAATPTVAGVPEVDITYINGVAASGAGTVAANVTQWNGSAVATPNVSGVPKVDPTHWNGTAVATPDTVGYPKVTIKSGTGTGEVSLSSGTVTTGAISAGAITATAIAADAITDAKVASDVTIASVTGSVGSVTGAVGSVTGAVGSVTGSVGSVAANGITASSIATDAIGALELAADAATEISSGVATAVGAITIETGLTLVQALQLVAAACAGKASGLATTSVVYRNAVADSKNRISATVDAYGNRSAITTDLT